MLDCSKWEVSNDETYPKGETFFLLDSPDSIFPEDLLNKVNVYIYII